MTVQDLAKAASAGNVLITVREADGTPIAEFKAKFWECIAESILTLQIEKLLVDALFGTRASISVFLPEADDSDPDVSEDEE